MGWSWHPRELGRLRQICDEISNRDGVVNMESLKLELQTAFPKKAWFNIETTLRENQWGRILLCLAEEPKKSRLEWTEMEIETIRDACEATRSFAEAIEQALPKLQGRGYSAVYRQITLHPAWRKHWQVTPVRK